MPKQVVGTFDHYYEIADKLASMGVKFVLLVQPVDSAVIMLSTIETPGDGKLFASSLASGLGNRFPDDDNAGDGTSYGPPV